MGEFLNGLLADGARKLAKPAGNKVRDWSRDLADNIDSNFIHLLPDDLQGLALAGSNVLRSHADVLGDSTEEAFLAASVHIAMGREDPARDAWLAGSASVDQLFAILDANSLATQQHLAERKARWAKVKEVILAFLQVAGSLAIPMLLAAM